MHNRLPQMAETPPFYQSQTDCLADTPPSSSLFPGVPLRCPLNGCGVVCVPLADRTGKVVPGQVSRTSCKSTVDYQVAVDDWQAEQERKQALAPENATSTAPAIGEIVGPAAVQAAVECPLPEDVDLSALVAETTQ